MEMKKKQNKDKQKVSKYSNEEISSAITLASLMSNECIEQTVIQVVNFADTSADDNKDNSIEGNELALTAQTSPPKTTSDENIQSQEIMDSERKQTSISSPTLPPNPSQSTINGYPYPYGNYYSYYPMDAYGYYSQYPYYPTYSMPSNYSAMSSRQCPYCQMTTPSMTSMPTHSSYPIPFNMTAELPKKMSETFGVNQFPVPQPQMMSNQIPISSLYPYYQNGPKVTSACVPSTEVQKN